MRAREEPSGGQGAGSAGPGVITGACCGWTCGAELVRRAGRAGGEGGWNWPGTEEEQLGRREGRLEEAET